MIRIFHLTDLPKEIVRVLLPKKLTKFLINEASKIAGNRKSLTQLIRKRLGKTVQSETIRDYFNRNYFVPLWFLFEIVNLLKENKINIDLGEIEKKVQAFRGPRGDAIYYPNFPWKEDERIIRILFHLMGDGHGGGDVCKGRVPVYSNTSRTLINELKRDLRFFGKVKIREYKRRRKGKNLLIDLEFPKVIGHVLKHLYNIEIIFPKTRIPKIIFQLDRNLIAHGIRAFIDDEGSVKSTEIHVYSANKPLLEGLKKLIKIKFPEFTAVTDVRLSSDKGSKSYYFAFLAPDLTTYKELIGFSHPQKLEKLNLAINIQNRSWLKLKTGESKFLILNSLLRGPKTSYEISKEIMITQRTINKYLNGFKDKSKYYPGLIEEGLVKPIKKIKKGVLVSITEKGKEVLLMS
jgi:DNA-binding HxlR family transcriptional regulator